MLKVGHRGARAYEPENTLRSYKKARALGAISLVISLVTTHSRRDYLWR